MSMSNSKTTNIDNLEEKLNTLSNKYYKRRKLKEFYKRFMTEYIYDEDLEKVDKFSEILKNQGLSNYATTVLEHPAYELKKYIDANHKELTREKKKKVLMTMMKYPDNHWWKSQDPAEIAAYQYNEETLLVDEDKYIEGLSKLLNRRVSRFEVYTKGFLHAEYTQALLNMAKAKSLEPQFIFSGTAKTDTLSEEEMHKSLM